VLVNIGHTGLLYIRYRCCVFELLQREGLSKYNKIYEFPYRLFNQNCTMSMTSVSGHLLNFEFVGQYKKWLAFTSLVRLSFMTLHHLLL